MLISLFCVPVPAGCVSGVAMAIEIGCWVFYGFGQ
jgi:hypothetical protein